MMAYLLRFHPGFISEPEAAISYYNDHSPSLEGKFKVAKRKQLTTFKKNPHLKSVRYADVRFARIAKFSYAIHYSIDEPAKEVLIHALPSDHQIPANRKRW